MILASKALQRFARLHLCFCCMSCTVIGFPLIKNCRMFHTVLILSDNCPEQLSRVCVCSWRAEDTFEAVMCSIIVRLTSRLAHRCLLVCYSEATHYSIGKSCIVQLFPHCRILCFSGVLASSRIHICCSRAMRTD
jgi:hypothetical protein